MVDARGDVNIAINVKWLGQTLGIDIDYVIVAVGTVVELDAKSALPFLGLQDVLRIGGVEEKAFKLDFTHTRKLRPRLDRGINVVAEAVVAFEKPDFWIEVWSHCAVLCE